MVLEHQKNYLKKSWKKSRHNIFSKTCRKTIDKIYEAHQNQKNIELALELIGQMTDSQYVFFKILGENGMEEVYQWIKDDPGQPMLRVPRNGTFLYALFLF